MAGEGGQGVGERVNELTEEKGEKQIKMVRPGDYVVDVGKGNKLYE
jgi:hypothetical protein